METMTFRFRVAVAGAVLSAVTLGTACKKQDHQRAAPSDEAATGNQSSRPAESAAGSVTQPTPATDSVAGGQSAKLATNHNGRIPILEYHVIGGEKNELYKRTVASFKAD